MPSRNPNLVITIFCVLLIAAAAIISQRRVKAAPPSGGSITGSIKLEGTPPHQRPIDMSKEPACIRTSSSRSSTVTRHRTIFIPRPRRVARIMNGTSRNLRARLRSRPHGKPLKLPFT